MTPPSQRGLDWLNFCIAALQTGFGAFVPVYLTLNGWTQAQIGAVLTAETVASMACQVPGGALVDAVPRRRLLLAGAVAGIATSALLLAALPMRLPVLLALLLHALAGSVLTPAIAALSLALAGRRRFGKRLGRNATFASIGSGLGAAAMGAVGTAFSERTVFLLAAALAMPALWALLRTKPRLGAIAVPELPVPPIPALALLRDRRVLAFAACILLFQISSAAVLPVAAAEVTRRVGQQAGLFIAAFILVPQAVVALLSPWIGQAAEVMGRRRLLLLGFLALPLRGAAFALIDNPYALAAAQALEGVGAAVMGVLLPLVAADLTRDIGRFNLCLGLFGLVAASGAALSTSFAGVVADRWGNAAAFWLLGGIGVFALLLVATVMPETREATPAQRGA